MFRIPAISSMEWPGKAADKLNSVISLVVFTLLDLLEIVFCMVFRILDALFEENSFPCYCQDKQQDESFVVDGGGGDLVEAQFSETLYQRKNIFRNLGLLKFDKKRQKKVGVVVKGRWSDCNCGSCGSWNKSGDHKLHVVLMEPSQASSEARNGKPAENVILLHGNLSSSSLWTETVFPSLSQTGKQNYRLFAVDLLGYGKSPKPWDSLYTLKDHVEMVKISVIDPFKLNSFHIVAHSMGCIVALAIAARYPKSVKSITLVAPPYFPGSKEKASLTVLNRLAERRVWPPWHFGGSIMSWYEHLGRSICFIVCRNHMRCEWILKLLTRRRDLPSTVIDMTRHTHHSVWHTVHNVLFGGAKLMDQYLESVKKSGALLTVIQGDKDEVVPVECSFNVKLKVPCAEVQRICNANHSTVIRGRAQKFTRDLENIWYSAAQKYHS